jgi:DNA primase
MVISRNIINEIKSSNNIESVVKYYLPNIKIVGYNWKTKCPFHEDNTPSFVVNPEKGIFKCFGCGVSGDVIKFVMLINNISWIEALKILAEKVNIKIYSSSLETVYSTKNKLYNILKISTSFYNNCLLNNINQNNDSYEALKYLKSRCLNYDTIIKFRIGFAPKNLKLKSILLNAGYTVEDIINSGVFAKSKNGNFEYECMSGRLVFPIYDIYGRTIAFGGRVINNQQKPKYINTSDTLIYSKSSNIYGLYQSLPLNNNKEIIILEGYIDTIMLHQVGFSNAVAILGTAFTKIQAKLIARYTNIVILLFDSDIAGDLAKQRALEILIGMNIECKIVTLPKGSDPDEYIKINGKEKFKEFINNNSKTPITFMLDRIFYSNFFKKKEISAETKMRGVVRILHIIIKTTSYIVQAEWIKNISQYLDINEDIVWKEFYKIQNREMKYKKTYDKKNYYTKSINKSYSSNKTIHISLSLEESLINLLLNNKIYINKITSNFFSDERCKKVFELLSLNLSNTEILYYLNKKDANWFSNLILSPIKYINDNESFLIIVNDIKRNKLKTLLKQYKKKMISTDNKEIKKKLFKKYSELIISLKGFKKK